MKRKDQFAKVVTYSVGGEIENISPEESDLRIIKSVLKINFVLRNKLGITLKEDSPIEMFLEFIEKLSKFLPAKKMANKKTIVVNPDGTREDVIAKHKKDFYDNPKLQEAVWYELRGEILGCFCKPLACHGDTYIEYIENRERIENETKKD